MLQVTLQAKEAEIQILSEEARSLKEELKIARMVLRSPHTWQTSSDNQD